MDIWQILMTPFSWLLKQMCILFNSYGIAMILFTVIIKLILLPFQFKQKKSMIQMNLLSFQQKEIQRKYANNPAKQNEELQRLYTENNINPMSGCLWSLVPMIIIFPLYAIIRRPLKYMMWLTEPAVAAVAGAVGMTDFVPGTSELVLAGMLNAGNLETVSKAAGVTGLFSINFNFLGLDLAQIPNWQFWVNGFTWASIGLFLLPVISAALSAVSSMIMQKTNAVNQQQQDPAMASQNRMMLIMMPLMSLWIGFSMPAGMCIYWITNSVLSTIQEMFLGRILKKDYEEAQIKLAEEAAKAKEAEKERRRLAAERKAAALAEKKSGKKKPALKKTEPEGPVIDKSASRVGMRTYARGRAYDPNRYPITPYYDPNSKTAPEPVEEPEELETVEEQTLPVIEPPPAEPAAPEENPEDYEPPYEADEESEEP